MEQIYEKQNLSAVTLVRELPAAERPREKILSLGVKTLSNTELLAVLIASGTAKNSALGLASKVLALGEGSLASLAHCQPEEFTAIPGIGTAKACVLAAAMELGQRIANAPTKEKIKIACPADAADLFMGDMRFLKKEVMQVALVNVKSELIMRENVSVGGLSCTVTRPREVFATAIRKGAHGVILAHNHPSGDPTPSEEDILITKKLAEAGDLLGIPVVDHIIIGDGRYTSMADQNLL